MVIVAGPGVASAIRNQFNQVSDAIGSGTVGENFYDAVDLPDPENGTAFAVYSEDDHSLMFYKRRGVPQVGDMFNYRTVTEVYTGFEDSEALYDENNYPISPFSGLESEVMAMNVVDSGIAPRFMDGWFFSFKKLSSVSKFNMFDLKRCQSLKYAMFGCESLRSIDLSSLNCPVLTTTGGLFERCWYLEDVNMDGLYAPQLKNLWFMFYGSSLRRLDLSSWKIGEIELAQSMFNECHQLESLTMPKNIIFHDSANLSEMFYNCKSLFLDCSDWNVSVSTQHDWFSYNTRSVTLPKAWK